jgi:hypothetical protein
VLGIEEVQPVLTDVGLLAAAARVVDHLPGSDDVRRQASAQRG